VSTVHHIVRSCDNCKKVIPDGDAYYETTRYVPRGDMLEFHRLDLCEKCQARVGAIIVVAGQTHPEPRVSTDLLERIACEYRENAKPVFTLTNELHRLLTELDQHLVR